MDREFFTGYNSELKDRSRRLRKDMTQQERHLWYDFLRHYPVKFYRQRSIDWFIADFYCSRARLVIEVDGGQHYTEEGAEYDRQRSGVLQKYGLEVLRFTNTDIDKHFADVCRQIEAEIRKRVRDGTPVD